MKRILIPVLAALAIATTVYAGQAAATTMVYRSMEELQAMSDTVVRGTIVEGHSFWSDEGTLFTDWTVDVREVISGVAPDVISVRQMGGEIDGLRAHIPGDAQFVQGEQVVLFLRESVDPSETVHYLTAMGQAKLTVSIQGVPGAGLPGGELTMDDQVLLSPVDATLVRDLEHITFYRNGDSGGEFYVVESEVITLQQLRDMATEGGAR